MSSSQSFPNASGFNLAFTAISVTETDSGSVTPFIGQTSSYNLLPVAGGEIEWAGFHTGVIAPGGSETLDFTYDVTSTNSADAITNLGLSMIPDSAAATGVSLTAVETVYNPTTNAELGQITVNLANPTAPPYTAGDIPLSIGETSLKVDVQVIASVSSTAASSAQATFSQIDQSFGQTPLTSLASIGDNVFLDTADTGIQSGIDAGPGVAGVTVDLENTSGTVLETTTTTNSQGLYDFTNLTPGTYQVQFVAPAGYTFSPQTSIANDLGSAPNQTTGITQAITVTSGESVTNIDAGLVPLGSIGDNVFLSPTDSGIQSNVNAGPGVAGVTVDLENASGTVLETTTTNSQGLYDFTDLTPGTYQVQFVAPSGYDLTPQTSIANDLGSAPNQTTGITAPITLAAGQNITNIDAGLYQPASIGDNVFLDTADTGIQSGIDAGPGVAGVTVDLENASGTVLETTTTNSQGLYDFTNLTPGTYQVQFVAPAGYTFSPQTSIANDLGSAPNQTTGITAPITVTSGESVTNIDAGLVPLGSIGDNVFLSPTDSGIQSNVNAGPGVAGVTVDLENTSGTVLETTTTNSQGLYDFTNLTPGTYQVQFVAPSGYDLTPQTSIANDLGSAPNQTTGITAPITLAAGQNITNIDAGLYQPASIGDNVFLDTADTGIQSGIDAGPGVAGVTVDLENTSGTVLETTTTNSQGLYDFTNLTPGTYQVQFVAPAGYTFSPQTSIANDLGSAPNQTTGITAPITVTSGESVTNIDAGLVPLTSTGGTSPSGPGISVIKVPGSMVVNDCGQVTYTFDVTNTGNTDLYNVQVTDNIGTASQPIDITATPVSSDSGVFAPGDTWQYTATVSYQAPSGGYQGGDSGQSGACGTNGQQGGNGGQGGSGGDSQQGGQSGGQGANWDTNQQGGQSNGWSSSGDNGQQGGSSGQSGWSSGGQQGGQSGGQGANCDTNQQGGQSNGWSSSGDNGQQGGSSGWSGWSNGGQQGGQSGGQGANCDTNQQSGQSNGWSSSGDNGQQGGSSGWSGWSSGGQQGGQSGGQGANCDTNQQSGQSNGWSSSGDNGQQGGSNGQSGWSSGGQQGGQSGGQGANCDQNTGGEQQPTNGNTGYADTVTVTASTCPPTSAGSSGCDNQQGGSSGQSGGNSGGQQGGQSGGQGANCDTNQQGGQSNGWSSSGDNGQQGGSNGWSGWSSGGQQGGQSGGQGANCDTNQQGGQSNGWSSSGDNGQQGGSSGQSGWSSGGQSGGQGTNCDTNQQGGQSNGWSSSGDNGQQGGSSGQSGWSSGGQSGGQGTNCDTNQQGGQSNGWSSSGDNGQQGGSSGQSGWSSGSQSGGQGTNCDTNQQGGNGGQGGSGDDNNQTPGTTTCVTVTATDTKEIQVLAANSDITVGGTAPTGNLVSLYGTAQTLEFTYNPGDTVSLAAGSTALASVTGDNTHSLAFMEISNNANPFASGSQIYFEGSVTAGENIYADAALNPLTNTANAAASGHFSTVPGAETYAFIFGSQADFTAADAPIQTMAYDTSGAHSMSLGDTIGSLKLAGYIGDHGGHLVA